MATVTIITDRNEGEPDILCGIKHNMLRIEVDGGEIARAEAPRNGWCDESLRFMAGDLCAAINAEGVIDAFLGECWVGSSEV